MINVTKTFLPEKEEYFALLKGVWDREWVTNNGELVLKLEKDLKNYLSIKNLWFTTNGTVPLQMALKVLKISGEVITTPFSYVATTNAILWENCKPVFVDINQNDLCINTNLIEAAITPNTQAILATHVYGLPCDVEKIEAIAAKHNLKVIYDAAHAFGVTLKGRSLLDFGDISTCSFHATKVFHTIEGGAIICNNDEISKQLYLHRQFGHIGDDYQSVGINGKNSEMHAAMGLCVLPRLKEIIESRKNISQEYDRLLNFNKIKKPKTNFDITYNYAYYPVIFESETQALEIIKKLGENNIVPRRYFYPSLNTLTYVKKVSCPISEDISSRIISLPLFFDLKMNEVQQISSIIASVIE